MRCEQQHVLGNEQVLAGVADDLVMGGPTALHPIVLGDRVTAGYEDGTLLGRVRERQAFDCVDAVERWNDEKATK